MADEAFALSPINARASLPSEADYDAIREAFMETARGRWFLSEYARRNRNADTSKVLDAVARIEQSMAAQKQAALGPQSLATIAQLIAAAKASALEALPSGEALAEAAQGARIIGEVARALRECGADRRICDLLDAQVAAIEAGHRAIGMTAARDAVATAFDSLGLRIAHHAAAAGTSPAPAPAEPERAAVVPLHPAPSAAAAAPRAAEPRAEPIAATAAVAPAMEEATSEQAHDEAVLDVVALAMAEDGGAISAPEAIEVTPAKIGPADLEVSAASVPDFVMSPPSQTAPETTTPPEPQSLGEAFLARTPRTPAQADPYAPFRRMTQAERIAYFS